MSSEREITRRDLLIASQVAAHVATTAKSDTEREAVEIFSGLLQNARSDPAIPSGIGFLSKIFSRKTRRLQQQAEYEKYKRTQEEEAKAKEREMTLNPEMESALTGKGWRVTGVVFEDGINSEAGKTLKLPLSIGGSDGSIFLRINDQGDPVPFTGDKTDLPSTGVIFTIRKSVIHDNENRLSVGIDEKIDDSSKKLIYSRSNLAQELILEGKEMNGFLTSYIRLKKDGSEEEQTAYNYRLRVPQNTKFDYVEVAKITENPSLWSN